LCSDVNVKVGKNVAEKIRIGDLAKQAGVTTRTIRYYEELGLLGHRQGDPQRAEGDFRYYTETDLARLGRIHVLKKLGLSLEQIGSVLDLFFEKQTLLAGKQKVLDMLQTHLRETEEKIVTLQQFRAELQENIAELRRIIEEAQAE
jgi:MerR family copper efflux transcriptional regulator